MTRKLILASLVALACGCDAVTRVAVLRAAGGTVPAFQVKAQFRQDRSLVDARVTKRLPRPGSYPVLFCRCFDRNGLTLQVVQARLEELVHAHPGAGQRVLIRVPSGAERVEVLVVERDLARAPPREGSP